MEIIHHDNYYRDLEHLPRDARDRVTARLPGTDLSASSVVRVGAPIVASFRIDQYASVAGRTATAGGDIQLTATAAFTDGQSGVATGLLRWESFSPGVAMADPAVPGLVHALAPGRATIVVTCPDQPWVWMSVEVFVR